MATIAALEGYETIVVERRRLRLGDEGLRRTLLRDEPGWAERAERFAAKVRDVTELLAEVEPARRARPVPMRLAYHDACHLAHAQGVAPSRARCCAGSRAGAARARGLGDLLRLGRRSTTCSSPSRRPSWAAARRSSLLATGAEAVAAANPGCALQITSHTGRRGTRLPVYHPLELLARSIAAAE